MTVRKISRALLSVSDKTGLLEFAKGLSDQGVMLISTGGTAKALRDAGLTVLDVSEITNFREMMDGRVKTLHPSVHGGLLALRDKSDHAAAMRTHGIEGIDLLVCNLYPFEATVARGADFETTIENIDIGGPAMTRSAAKNHDWTTVVVDVEDYKPVLAEMAAHDGATTRRLRRILAQRAFARTAAYDAAVSNWFAGELEKDGVEEPPRRRALGGLLRQKLRYGENPHQKAAFYADGSNRPGVATATRSPVPNSRNGCSSAGRGSPKSSSHACEPNPTTHVRLPVGTRLPTRVTAPRKISGGILSSRRCVAPPAMAGSIWSIRSTSTMIRAMPAALAAPAAWPIDPATAI